MSKRFALILGLWRFAIFVRRPSLTEFSYRVAKSGV